MSLPALFFEHLQSAHQNLKQAKNQPRWFILVQPTGKTPPWLIVDKEGKVSSKYAKAKKEGQSEFSFSKRTVGRIEVHGKRLVFIYESNSIPTLQKRLTQEWPKALKKLAGDYGSDDSLQKEVTAAKALGLMLKKARVYSEDEATEAPWTGEPEEDYTEELAASGLTAEELGELLEDDAEEVIALAPTLVTELLKLEVTRFPAPETVDLTPLTSKIGKTPLQDLERLFAEDQSAAEMVAAAVRAGNTAAADAVATFKQLDGLTTEWERRVERAARSKKAIEALVERAPSTPAEQAEHQTELDFQLQLHAELAANSTRAGDRVQQLQKKLENQLVAL